MNLSEKIEEIRRQPQHVRLRYVWGCVTISMFAILIIWFFSIATLFKSEDNPPEQTDGATNLKDQLQNVSKQAPSIKDYIPNQALEGEGINKNQELNNSAQESDFQYPAESLTSEVPTSPAYDPQQ